MLVAALSLVAFAVRWVISTRGGLWRDEALFLYVTRLPTWGAVVEFLRSQESHPPLFYAVMRWWQALFGVDDVAAVVLPVLLGVALVPSIYRVGTGLFGPQVGMLAAAMAALSPALIEQGAFARPYSLLPLLTLWSVYALVRGIERGGRAWIGYVLGTLALVYTHNWPWLIVAGEWAAVTLIVIDGPVRGRPVVAREWALAQGAVAAGFLPWVANFVYQARHAGHGPLVLSGAGDIPVLFTAAAQLAAHSTVFTTAIGGGPGGWVIMAQVVAMAALIAAALVHSRRSPRIGTAAAPSRAASPAAVVLLVVPVVAWTLAVVASVRTNMLFPRCLVMLAPPLLVAMAAWIVRLWRGGTRPAVAAATAVLLVAYVASLASLARTSKSNARELARAVAARTERSDLVIVAPEWLASSFNRYYAPAVEQIDYPTPHRQEVVSFADLRARMADPRALLRAQQAIAAARAEPRRVWLVMERRDVRDLTPTEEAEALSSPSFSTVGLARANQLRAYLAATYGAPDSSVAARVATRQEAMRAYLFTASSASGAR